MTISRPTRWIVLAVVACAVVAVAGVQIYSMATTRHAVAYFTNTVGLYAGDTVRVLGVKVGTIDSIEPEGTRVKVSMSYRDGIEIPRDATAAIIAPTLVTGRYVQLSPVYESGPTLDEGGSIPVERTAVPVPYDEIKTQLSSLAQQLGPNNGANNGALTQFVSDSAGAFKAAGPTVNTSITELSRLADTLNRGGPDLYSTIRNLSAFVTALSAGSDQISGFNRQLASVASVLAGNRAELDALLKTLAATVIHVQRVVAANRAELNGDIASLEKVTGLLANRQDSLAQILHAAPTALGNLYNIYDPGSNSLTGNLAIPDVPDPYTLICALLTTVNAPADQCRKASETFGTQLTSALLRSRGTATPRSVRDLLTARTTPTTTQRGGR